MSKRAQRILDEIMPQVYILFKKNSLSICLQFIQIISGNDIEQRAFACFILARCILSVGGSDGGPHCCDLRRFFNSLLSGTALKKALNYLLISEADFVVLDIPVSLSDVRYLISVVYHNLGMVNERNQIAQKVADAFAQQQKNEAWIWDDKMSDILNAVAMVGVALASR